MAAHGVMDLRRPNPADVIRCHPEKCATGTPNFARGLLQLDNKILHDLSRLVAVGVGIRPGAVGYAEASNDLGCVAAVNLLNDGMVMIHHGSERGSSDSLQNRTRDAVVVLRHDEINILMNIFQYVEVGRSGHKVDVHRGVCDEVGSGREPTAQCLRDELEKVRGFRSFGKT